MFDTIDKTVFGIVILKRITIGILTGITSFNFYLPIALVCQIIFGIPIFLRFYNNKDYHGRYFCAYILCTLLSYVLINVVLGPLACIGGMFTIITFSIISLFIIAWLNGFFFEYFKEKSLTSM